MGTVISSTTFGPEDGVWRTVRGRRIFIRKGQSLQDALAARKGTENPDDPKKFSPHLWKKSPTVTGQVTAEVKQLYKKLSKGGKKAVTPDQLAAAMTDEGDESYTDRFLDIALEISDDSMDYDTGGVEDDDEDGRGELSGERADEIINSMVEWATTNMSKWR